MAEGNPKIEFKIPKKPIENARQTYLAENENLIIGPRGFRFAFNTSKDKLGSFDKSKTSDNSKMKGSKNKRNINKNNQSNKSAENAYYNKKTKNIKEANINPINSMSKTLMDRLEQPTLRFTDRTDLERIINNLKVYTNKNEEDLIRGIKDRHIHLIDHPKITFFPMIKSNSQGQLLNDIKNKNFSGYNTCTHINNNGIINFNDYKGINNSSGLNKLNPFASPNKKLMGEEFYEYELKSKGLYSRLRQLNREAKKVKSDFYYKTHFKGVESIFIQPDQMYDAVRKEHNTSKIKQESFVYDKKKENEGINEYKEDEQNILLEEKGKQNITNSKSFYNYINNRKHFYKNYIGRPKNYEEESRRSKTYSKRGSLENIKKLKYLRGIAFGVDENIDLENPNTFNDYSKTNRADDENSSSIFIELNKKPKGSEENEEKININGKTFLMNHQMELIAKEVLDKCRVYHKILKK